jgi:glycerophosphoryl diester phosphodiesterase
MEAFQAAVDLGAHYLELDIHSTSDGALIVHHDDNLSRLAARDSPIKLLTSAELDEIDIAYNFTRDGANFPFRGRGLRAPLFEEVLRTFPRQLFIIEIKQSEPSLIAPLLTILRDTGMMRRVLIASEHQAPLDEVRSLAPSLPTNLSASEVGAFMMSLPPGAPRYEPRGDALQVPPEYMSWKLATSESIAAAHRLGLEVHVWTVNDEPEMRELLAMGVDGLITDYPARLLKVLASL